jgi:hypothetical protein
VPETIFRFLKPADGFRRRRLRLRREQPASEHTRGPLKLAYGSRSERIGRRRRRPAAEAGGRVAKQTASDASRRNHRGGSGSPAGAISFSAGAIRCSGGAIRCSAEQPDSRPSNQVLRRATRFSTEQPDARPKQSDSRPSNQIHTRGTTRRVRAVESVSAHRPRRSTEHSVPPFKHHAPAPHTLACAPLPIGPARARIFIELRRPLGVRRGGAVAGDQMMASTKVALPRIWLALANRGTVRIRSGRRGAVWRPRSEGGGPCSFCTRELPRGPPDDRTLSLSSLPVQWLLAKLRCTATAQPRWPRRPRPRLPYRRAWPPTGLSDLGRRSPHKAAGHRAIGLAWRPSEAVTDLRTNPAPRRTSIERKGTGRPDSAVSKHRIQPRAAEPGSTGNPGE